MFKYLLTFTLLIPFATICMQKECLNEALKKKIHAEKIAYASNLFILLKSPDNKLVLLINQKNRNLHVADQPFTSELLTVFRKAPTTQKDSVKCLIHTIWLRPIRERLVTSKQGEDFSFEFATQNSKAGNPIACEHIDAALIESRLYLIGQWLTWTAKQQPQDGVGSVKIVDPDLNSFSLMYKTVYGTEMNAGSNSITVTDLLQTIAEAKKTIVDACATRPQLKASIAEFYAHNNAEQFFSCLDEYFKDAEKQNVFEEVNRLLESTTEFPAPLMQIFVKTNIQSLHDITQALNILYNAYTDVQKFLKLEEELKKHSKIIFFSDHSFNNLGRLLIDRLGYVDIKDMMLSDGPLFDPSTPRIEAFIDFHKNLLKAAKILVGECTNCGTIEKKLLKCGRCKNAYYCSVDCQQKDWTAGHKQRCIPAVEKK